MERSRLRWKRCTTRSRCSAWTGRMRALLNPAGRAACSACIRHGIRRCLVIWRLPAERGTAPSVAVTGRIFGVENGGSSACFRSTTPARRLDVGLFYRPNERKRCALCSPLPRRNRRQKRFWKLRRSGCFTMPSGWIRLIRRSIIWLAHFCRRRF